MADQQLPMVPNPGHATVRFESPQGLPLTVDLTPRRIIVFPLTEGELEAVASLSNSIHLTFFGFCGGAFIAFATLLSTVTLTPMQQATYVGLTAVSLIATIFFAISSLRGYKAARKKLNEIKRGTAA